MIDAYEVVKKLIGPIDPTGDSRVDEQRMENMKACVDLTQRLCVDIWAVAPHKDSHMHSMKKLGEAAQDFINVLEEHMLVD